MPTVIEYSVVLASLQSQGLRCHYHNSGAFGFAADAAAVSRGWIGPADASIRDAIRPMVRQVPEPYAGQLVDLFTRARRRLFAGPVWVMPKSHWAFELEYGSATWMPGLLKDIGLDPAIFKPLNTAAAIEFVDDETDVLAMFVRRLLDGLTGSDFQMAFPARATICTIHSHVQLWWTTSDLLIAAGLDELVPGESP